jgi:hypothetical protein
MAAAKLRSRTRTELRRLLTDLAQRAQGVDLQRAISTASTAAASDHNETAGLLARGRAYLGDGDVGFARVFSTQGGRTR